MQDATNNYSHNADPASSYERASLALNELVPNPDTIWGSITYTSLKAATPAIFREVSAMSRQQDQQLQQVVGPISRAMDKALMVRAVVVKHEASKLEGFLAEEFSAAGISIASNTDADSAINAGVFRLLSSTAGVATIDKYRVTRAAKAMRGIEIICEEAGLELTFGMAGEILDEIATSSRKSLCDLVDQRLANGKATATGEPPAAEPADDPLVSGPAALLAADGDASGVHAPADNLAAELVEHDEGPTPHPDNGPTAEPSRPLIAAPPIEPDLLANFEAIGSVVLDQALPEANMHLVALMREGGGYVLKGPICSGDDAAKLIRQATAG